MSKMKKIRNAFILIFLSMYLSSCAVVAITALAGAVVLGIDLAGNAAKKGLKNSIENKQEGSITFSDVTIQKKDADSSGVLMVKGVLQVIPGTKNNERFRNLSDHYFVLSLYDQEGHLLKRIYQKPDGMKGVDIANVEVNKSYQVNLPIEALAKNIFALVSSVKFERVSDTNTEAKGKPTLK